MTRTSPGRLLPWTRRTAVGSGSRVADRADPPALRDAAGYRSFRAIAGFATVHRPDLALPVLGRSAIIVVDVVVAFVMVPAGRHHEQQRRAMGPGRSGPSASATPTPTRAEDDPLREPDGVMPASQRPRRSVRRSSASSSRDGDLHGRIALPMASGSSAVHRSFTDPFCAARRPRAVCTGGHPVAQCAATHVPAVAPTIPDATDRRDSCSSRRAGATG